jgi:hypothetical protein
MNGIEKKNGRARAQAVMVSGLLKVGDVERELDWFFTTAEGEMGDCSNYESTLTSASPEYTRRTAEDRVEAAHTHSSRQVGRFACGRSLGRSPVSSFASRAARSDCRTTDTR